jgi:hypothetical protein
MSEETSTVSNPQQLETGGWSENLQGSTKKIREKLFLPISQISMPSSIVKLNEHLKFQKEP